MNQPLTIQIIRHIFSNLGIIPTNVDLSNASSLLSPAFQLTNESLSFETNQKVIHNKIWGCSQKEMQIILGDCTIDLQAPEYACVVSYQNSPSYGLYLVYNDGLPNCLPDPLIAVSSNHKNWMMCETYLQATFLAGMEQVRELGFAWNKLQSHQQLLSLLKSFIRFHEDFYGTST